VNVTVLAIGDGRDEIHARSRESLKEALLGDPATRTWVDVDDRDHELGFAGAIDAGWRACQGWPPSDYIFHAELDFVYEESIDLAAMIAVLEAHPHLAQLVLKRQPVNAEEQAAGGIVEQWPDEYRQRTHHGHVFTEHRLFWSTNPGLYPAAWCAQGWPQVPRSEEAWTKRLVEDPDLRFAFWGGKLDPPRVTHIGDVRAGHGY
jgi:hypothetical protein